MNNNNPKVSILIPVYGVESRIERCAISLFEQTYDNLEYIFVNDKTPDKSIEILNEIIKRYPSRANSVKIIEHNKNSGLAVARNTAVENSTGEFVIHVDSDDYLDINAVKLLIEKQKENNTDIVAPEYIIYHSKHSDYWEMPEINNSNIMTIEILKRNTIVSVAGRLIRNSLYKDYGIKAMENINMGEDYSVSPLLYFYAKRVGSLHKGLYHYDCTNENSYTATFSEQKSNQVWDVITYLENFFNDKGVEYTEALNSGKLSLIVQQMKACSINGNNKIYHNELKNRLTNIDKRLWDDLPIADKIVLYTKNYFTLKLYTKTAFFIKKKIKFNN